MEAPDGVFHSWVLATLLVGSVPSVEFRKRVSMKPVCILSSSVVWIRKDGVLAVSKVRRL